MIRFNSGMRSIRIFISTMPYNAMNRLIFAIAGLSSEVIVVVLSCCSIRQVTSWSFGLVVTVGAGLSMSQGAPFPYCISTNASLSLVVSVGAGASMEWLCPFP